ncbi:MAG: alpha/beta hydrolase [Anaerolineae bacterium]|jgi:predicted esterase|nr:alpha/beta hydrolase [Anaerolineae bacterium]
MTTRPLDPHADVRIYATGTPLDQARAALILIHGRGSSAHDILGLAQAVPTDGVAVLAPDAVGSVWYPQRFMRPTSENEPFLSSALNVVERLINTVIEAGIPREKIVIAGFSQGACLASEYVARNPQRYGGLGVFSGGLIGESVPRSNYPADGGLAGTPVFVGCSDVDFHIPLERVQETSAVLRALGGSVTERIYPGMDHTINDDELTFFAGMLKGV